MNKIYEEIYQRILNTKVSYSCELAAINYYNLIIPYCIEETEINHSLVRILIRPLFYLGISNASDVIDWLGNNTEKCVEENNNKFMIWLKKNENLISLCIKELQICCEFYDLNYDNNKRCVILNDNMFFYSFVEFKDYFYLSLDKLGIDKGEIDRIIIEENYSEIFDKC